MGCTVLGLDNAFLTSAFFISFYFLGVFISKMVRVGRWSDSGGDIVPAVTGVSVCVVSVTSMMVLLLYRVSYLVGVVVVVCRSC